MADLMDELTGSNGNGHKEPAEKEPPKILRCHEAERIARELIQLYHGHLINATILCLTTSQTRKKKGKPVEATTKKTDPLLHHFSEADFIILIDETHWMYLEEDRKRALIDRQLCYCGVDDRGKWVIWPTDVECFIAEITRNGLWREDVRVFVEAARGIPGGV
jgi:putative metallopeptidase